MPKITSIDALIERIKIAYPNKVDWPDRCRKYMEKGNYAEVYDLLNNSGFGRLHRILRPHEVLETIDDDDNVIPGKFAELVKKARQHIQEYELEPVRQQLQEDFRFSYNLSWIAAD